MSAAVLKSNQPIQFGSGGPAVTLKFSSQSGPSGSTLYRKPGYNAQFRPLNNYAADIIMGDGPGRRLRKNVANVRRHVDYVSNILNHYEQRLWQYGKRRRIVQQPDELYQNTALPAWCTPDVPVDCILTKFVRAAMNKVKCPVYSLCWTPEGKRLITGASTGEFTLWNGTAFNFETILQAHDSAIRAMTWSHNEQWLVSGDHDGYIKYWQPNMNNVHMYQAHKEDPIRGLSFAPTDVKLVSASDDGTARIWDFARCSEERVLRGHGSEVRCVDWHPQKGLVVTGSRDSQQPVKLWDPKSGQCLSTLQDHKSSVMAVQWNSNGNWLLTGGRDHLIKLYDIRIMKEMHTFRGHKKEVTSLAWNPVHENLFVSGGGDGSIAYWLVGTEKEVGLLEHAHDQAIWAMQFHPKGHILSTGSNDNNTKFWARNRPGDTQEDIFGLASFNTNMVGALDKEREPKPSHIRIDEETILAATAIPGMGLDDDVYAKMNREIATNPVTNANNMLLMPEDLNSRKDNMMNNSRKVLLKQPPPKKAQRQFERMWNVSKPGAAGDEGGPNQGEDVYRQPKASLLGAPPPTSLLVPPGPSLMGSAGPPPPSLMNGGRAPAGPPPLALLAQTWGGNQPPPQLSREAFDLGPQRPPERLGPAFDFQGGRPRPPPQGAPWGAQQPPPPLDFDYRSGRPSGGIDVDLRGGQPTSDTSSFPPGPMDMSRLMGGQPPPPISLMMGMPMGPPAPTASLPQNDNWRQPPPPQQMHQEQGPSRSPADPRMNDPRLRRPPQQQDEIRDPRRRQPNPPNSRDWADSGYEHQRMDRNDYGGGGDYDDRFNYDKQDIDGRRGGDGFNGRGPPPNRRGDPRRQQGRPY